MGDDVGELGPTWSLDVSMCGRAGSHYILPNLCFTKILKSKGKVAICCHVIIKKTFFVESCKKFSFFFKMKRFRVYGSVLSEHLLPALHEPFLYSECFTGKSKQYSIQQSTGDTAYGKFQLHKCMIFNTSTMHALHYCDVITVIPIKKRVVITFKTVYTCQLTSFWEKTRTKKQV